MDLKADDVLNVDIDTDLLLSYELDKLNLDSIPNDIFDQIKLTDESPKNDDKIDAKNDFLLKDNKINELALSNSIEIKTENTSDVEDDAHDTEIKAEILSDFSEIKKDINGNDESVSEENLNDLFDHLDLSDSDNEEVDDVDHLKKRGPVRSSKSKRASRKKDINNYDRSQFNSDRLKHLCGSSQIQYNESAVPNHCAVYNNGQTIIYNGVESFHNLLGQEQYFEDARASSVSSPESGYDSSSAHSITGSPPPVFFSSCTSSGSLDFIPETVDEQNILDFLIENTDSALIDNSLAACKIDDKDAKGKITEIINFLKEPIPSHSTVSTISEVTSSFVSNCLDARSSPVSDTSDIRSSPISNTSDIRSSPILNTSDVRSSPISSTSDVRSSPVLNTSDVTSTPVSCSTVSKTVELKKLVPKLKDNAKGALRKFLSQDEYYDAKKRIYAKIREDEQNRKPVSVIYVEDEMEKDSKNRTNLHNAVLNRKIEDIFSIVEIHKQYNLPFGDINIRDKNGKTALDYAIQNEMTRVADYLRENTAVSSLNLEK